MLDPAPGTNDHLAAIYDQLMFRGAIAHPALRERLASIPTGLTIPAEDSAALVQLGESLVRDNAKLRGMASEAGFPALEAAAPPRHGR